MEEGDQKHINQFTQMQIHCYGC